MNMKASADKRARAETHSVIVRLAAIALWTPDTWKSATMNDAHRGTSSKCYAAVFANEKKEKWREYEEGGDGYIRLQGKEGKVSKRRISLLPIRKFA